MTDHTVKLTASNDGTTSRGRSPDDVRRILADQIRLADCEPASDSGPSAPWLPSSVSAGRGCAEL